MDIFNEVVGRHMGGQLIPVTRFGSTMQTFTPQWVVKDMIELLPDQVWNEHTTFLDISCKTGIFLMEIYKKLDEVLSKNPKYADTATRRSHILNEQLYGLALDDKECLWYSSRNVYGRIGAKNMKYLHAGGYSYDQLVKNKKVEYMKALIQEEFGRNMFDVVVGNPPYNNDIYLDFVTLAQAIQTQNVCMITPAKWQAKGGPKNEAFRRDIVPYMSKIVFYPNCKDVFNINDPGGLSYYLIESKQSAVATVINRCKRQVCFNNENTRAVCRPRKTLNNLGQQIFEHISTSAGYRPFSIESMPKNGRYEVWLNNKISVGSAWDQTLYDKSGAFHCISLCRVIDSADPTNIMSVPDDSRLAAAFDSASEGYSFQSWIYTKFVRFGVSNSLCGLTGIATSDNWWRFVPDPGKFDHIFTDQELYKKYNLTDEEINIIESVIKERK